MNGQNAAEVRQQVLDSLARLTTENATPAVSININGPILNRSILHNPTITGTINVAGSNAPVGDESAQLQPQPQPVPEAVADPFHSTYTSFRDGLKWRLPSGSTVEDILFREYSRADLPEQVRKSIRHWTVLVDNEDMRRFFLPQDWQAILAQVKPLPRLSDPVVGFFKRNDGLSQQRLGAVKVALQQHGLPQHAGWNGKQLFVAQLRGHGEYLFVIANGGGHGTTQIV